MHATCGPKPSSTSTLPSEIARVGKPPRFARWPPNVFRMPKSSNLANGPQNPGGAQMNPAAEFRHHATECRHMVRATRDVESRATWLLMAERWARCAELEDARAASKREAPRQHYVHRSIYQHAS